MSDAGPDKRSFEPIGADDLRRLGVIARRDLDGLFARKTALAALYRDRLIGLALCQGAAEHFVRGTRGVNDFDVWAFFRSCPERKFPYRRTGKADFGESKFGRNPDDRGYIGRRVDLLGRDIASAEGEESSIAIRRFLMMDKNTSTRFLVQRPVVLICPEAEVGRVIWDPISDVPLKQ